MDKKEIVLAIVAELTREKEELTASLETTRQAANDAPGAMQSHSDTTKYQMSQLAERIAESLRQREIAIRELVVFTDEGTHGEPAKRIELGSLVEVEVEGGEKKRYIILPAGSGIQITRDDFRILVVMPTAPIAAALLDKRQGDTVNVRLPAGNRTMRIVSIE